MRMFNPPHPGRLVLHQLIEDEDGNKISSVAEVAAKLGCHRTTLNKIINGSAGITPAMALALEQVGGSSAEMWLSMQNSYDLFHLRHDNHAA